MSTTRPCISLTLTCHGIKDKMYITVTRKYFSNDQRTVEQLLDTLGSENWVERRAAARELGYRGDLLAVVPLIQALKDLKSDVRSQAALSLGILGDKRAIDSLIAMFSNPNEAYISARALARIKSRRVVKPLIAGLKSDNRAIRLSAAEVLGEIGDQRAVDPLIESLNDENNSVRNSAAVSLGKLKDKRAIKPLLAILRDTDEQAQNNTTSALGELSDEEVQASAIIALGNLRNKKVIRPILKFLTFRNRNLMEAAVLALGELQARVAVEALLKILNNHDKTNLARHFAAVALGKIGDKRALNPLISALSDDDVVIRIAAADGLGQLRDNRAIPVLNLARKNDKGTDEFGRRVKDHATKAIHRIQQYARKGH